MPGLSICIVSPDAFGAMTGGASGHAGGVERQTTLTARWLAARGHAVTLVVWDEGQPAEMTVDGVRVIKMCREADGTPVARFFHPRWTSLNRALRAADARVYYQNCAEYVTGQVALWCRRHGRRFVYSVASDPECNPALPALTRRQDRVFFRYGLRHADRIVTQTHHQREMLLSELRLSSTVLPMPCPGPAELPRRRFPRDRPRVAWVGRIAPEKRPEWLLDVAAGVPGASFDVAGAWSPSDAGSLAFVGRAEKMTNVRLRGHVSRDQMAGVYADAAALLCTSEYEGFPNTFLEAWSFGVPVVTSVDPDGMIVRSGLGAVSHTLGGLTTALRSLLESPEEWESISSRARAHYVSHHTLDAAMGAFEALFAEVDGQATAGRAGGPATVSMTGGA
jgi:glycosyltransferase involved in cell wall biosynthesis